jgi:hypothetical protein
MGWRYLILTLGAITFAMFICRFLLFHLYESPKFLLSRGRQAEAVATVYGIAHYNKTTTWLTEDILNYIGGNMDATGEDEKLSMLQTVKRSLGRFSMKRFSALFQDKKLGLTTLLLWVRELYVRSACETYTDFVHSSNGPLLAWPTPSSMPSCPSTSRTPAEELRTTSAPCIATTLSLPSSASRDLSLLIGASISSISDARAL